ncbi:MAG: cobalt-precorrin-5B (C(1))-methyltransferase [Candidatus Acididesulfobacter guangdongensis]|uniref:Cobalt-precorrin-5B C(1)-methyltransferase n=1 Tax=Acididesulfobacter guangdongensis TaxID=2597225 RepID=A0A519BFN3_ACIG2|nr:MAG: cobalt-precorrin-5B (C(1))-methyltransferase [Candidatus Acididesulfobacter guangdongensis]
MDILYSKGGLKKGFSTGTVSAGAIRSSIRYYFTKEKFETISVDMPGGESVNIDVMDLSHRFLKNGIKISTAVIQKFSGDDIDVTGGIKIYADFMIICKKVNKNLNIQNNNKGADEYEYDNDRNNDSDKIIAEDIENDLNNSDKIIAEVFENDLKDYFNEFYHNKLTFYDKIINTDAGDFFFSSAEGIGIATKQGLPVRVGYPAVNPVPKDMIKKNALNELNGLTAAVAVCRFNKKINENNKVLNDSNDVLQTVNFFLSVLYIPDGEEISKKTLNSRLGINGGLSILGTTGYVVPISAKAWLDTIKSSLNFLSENNINLCVFTPGRFSEKCAMKIFTDLPEEYFIEIGDFVSYSVRKAADFGIKNIILTGQFGKIVKISQGERNTNAKYSRLNLNYIGEIIKNSGYMRRGGSDDYYEDEDDVSAIYKKVINSNTSREAFSYIENIKNENIKNGIINKILYNAKNNIEKINNNKVKCKIILLSYSGEKIFETK